MDFLGRKSTFAVAARTAAKGRDRRKEERRRRRFRMILADGGRGGLGNALYTQHKCPLSGCFGLA